MEPITNISARPPFSRLSKVSASIASDKRPTTTASESEPSAAVIALSQPEEISISEATEPSALTSEEEPKRAAPPSRELTLNLSASIRASTEDLDRSLPRSLSRAFSKVAST
ncbi:unannotated protein [freshwater metagenome]|uniref:Unannotated protein n=1 Tax=freshwater metagenome TaxID=449393 RepID=A0A6J6RHD7_9ZZZZ